MPGLSCGMQDFSLRCAGSSLRRAGFSLVVVCGLLSSCGAWAPGHVGSVVAARRLSSYGVWAPELMGSLVVVCGLSSCGTQG